jgi:PadR family transcriptional regulator PadR
MTSPHDPQLLKGVLSLLLLRLLADRESYGYELVQRLHDVGLSGVNDGTVYPALARLEREGRIGGRLVASTSGPARKYYRPTSEGHAALQELTGSWLALADMVTPLVTAPVPTQPTVASEVL